MDRVIGARPGIATVVEATSPKGRQVALTILPAASDKERREEVLRLAKVQGSLKHPHLLPVLRARDKGGHAYYVTALPRTETLADRLRRGSMEPVEAMRVLAQVAAAVELAASKGLVHRDLRPAAVALTPRKGTHAVLTDFGIMRPRAKGCELLGAADGVAYRSPEELRGEPPRLRSSVYSLGCILVECLTGEPPFRHERPLLTVHAHLVEPPPRVSDRDAGLPPALDAVVAKALAKDPRERFHSPAELLEAAGRAVGLDVRVPVVADKRKQRAREKVATRERRRQRRRAARAPARRAIPLLPLRAQRPARVSLWAGAALLASAVSGFATGNASWSPDPRPSAVTRPAPAGPSAASTQRTEYLRDVNDTVARLGERRAAGRGRLRSADGHRRQSAAAKRLAAAYRDARAALPSAPVPDLGGAGLAGSLRNAERAYAGLATAARKTDRRAWQAARVKTARSEQAVERALELMHASYDRLQRQESIA